ncbi:MAG: hypothetical protein JSU85_05145, partial [Candidatus Zixiibacteriota bacterium]
MTKEVAGIPTIKKADAQIDENLETLKKSVNETMRIQLGQMQRKIDLLEANQQKAQIPGTFMGPAEPWVKSFDKHLEEDGRTLAEHLELVAESLNNATFTGLQPAITSMQKSLSTRQLTTKTRCNYQKQYQDLRKSFGNDKNRYIEMAKSILGDSGTPGEPGAWYYFLEENLSRYIQRIMLENDDATALKTIPTSITPSIVPEMGRLKNSGVGYGKHTTGFKEGRTAVFGGSQTMDRIVNNLVQRGVRCAVTQLLLANRQKLLNNNPLALQRELRALECNRANNHHLLYGDPNINKDGNTVLEMEGMLSQMKDANKGYPDHIWDWDGQVFDENNSPLDLFRKVAEDLIINGFITGGTITGKYNVLMDFGVANYISRFIDDKQRILVEPYEKAALMYGQAFAGFVTDLGVFRFQRSRTLHLTANDTWTQADDVSNHAIAFPAIQVDAIPQSQVNEPKSMPVGNYRYRVSVVNDHGESDISDAFVTTSDGSAPVAVGADEVVEITIPWNAA